MTQQQSDGPAAAGPEGGGPEGGALEHQRRREPFWRTSRPLRALLVAGVGAASLTALVGTAVNGVVDPEVALAFCLVIAAGPGEWQ